jgi:hypothetical protein
MDWATIWGISVTIALICMCIYTMSLHEAISSIYNLLERIVDSVYSLAQIILEEEDKK